MLKLYGYIFYYFTFILITEPAIRACQFYAAGVKNMINLDESEVLNGERYATCRKSPKSDIS